MSDTKKTKKVNKLSDLTIDEVSLVDRGANQHAKLVVSKRADDLDEDDEVTKADPDPSGVSAGEEDDEDETPKDESKTGDEEVDEGSSKGDGFFKRLISKIAGEELTTDSYSTGTITDMSDVEKAFPGQPDPRKGMMGGQQPPMPPPQQAPFQQGAPAPGPQGMMPQGPQAFPAGQVPGQQPGQMQAGPPLPQEVIQYIQQLEQALAEAQGETPSGDQEDSNVSGNQNPFGKSLTDMDADEVEFLTELAKNLEDEDMRESVNKALEAVEKANARAEEAETIAKAEREHRETQEFIAKARAYTSLPVKAEEFGPVLKRLHETLDEDEIALVTKVLSAANETVASVGAFDEIGKRGSGVGYETISKVDSAAQEIAKSENISIEQARERVFEQTPSLYDEYVNESGR